MNFHTILSFMRRVDRRFFDQYLLKLLFKFRNYPTGLCVDISGTCNLACKTCSLKTWYPKDMNRIITDIALEKLYTVIPKLTSIALMNNCEPLINKNIATIISTIKKINPKIHISFVTNGMLLSAELSEKLVELAVDHIYFSIDGATPETNDKIRIGSNLNKVINNIEILNRLKKNRNTKLPIVGIITVANKDNVNELLDIVDLAKKLEVEVFRVNGVEPYTTEMDKLKLWDVSENEYYSRKLKDISMECSRSGINFAHASLTPKDFSSCLLTEAVIDANGDVYPCSSLSYNRDYYYLEEKHSFPRISFGNLHNNSFDEIWHSPNYTKFRKDVLAGNFPEYCKNCLFQRKVTCA